MRKTIMNYTSYIRGLRGNLCQVLTQLRNNEKKINDVREEIEAIGMARSISPLTIAQIEEELNIEIGFYLTLNDVYNTEVNRLIKIILENPTEI
jgi:hypothetical protein